MGWVLEKEFSVLFHGRKSVVSLSCQGYGGCLLHILRKGHTYIKVSTSGSQPPWAREVGVGGGPA